MCSEEATLIGIIFSCERWGLECARGDIQCGPRECPRWRPTEEKSKSLASLASEAANEQLEMMSITCNWTVAGAPWQ